MEEWIPGIVVRGHGVASGASGDRRFPGGTIRLQKPFFQSRGIDLSAYWPGTVNIDLAPVEPVPRHPLFDERVAWFDGVEERFILSPAEIEIRGRRFAGLWYYPHPETKPEHFQAATVVELLLPWIDGLAAGDIVAVRLP
ncbi:MAG TPA: hypothetical protein VEC06_10300 [Paucimonas sp.]|nr:hypothetical protein [Paucimonas sp.]